MSEFVFQPLGPDRDAIYWVGPSGAEFTAGGLAMTLRDMARFGQRVHASTAARLVVAQFGAAPGTWPPPSRQLSQD